MTEYPPDSSTPSSTSAPGQILVIDDSELVLQAISTALSAEGYKVITTSQPVGAARHLKSCDLVIVDFHMPGFDGPTVLKSLKSAMRSSGANCMFVLYTSEETLARQYAAHGFHGAFTQKGNIPLLVTQVQAVMRQIRKRAFARVR